MCCSGITRAEHSRSFLPSCFVALRLKPLLVSAREQQGGCQAAGQLTRLGRQEDARNVHGRVLRNTSTTDVGWQQNPLRLLAIIQDDGVASCSWRYATLPQGKVASRRAPIRDTVGATMMGRASPTEQLYARQSSVFGSVPSSVRHEFVRFNVALPCLLLSELGNTAYAAYCATNPAPTNDMVRHSDVRTA